MAGRRDEQPTDASLGGLETQRRFVLEPLAELGVFDAASRHPLALRLQSLRSTQPLSRVGTLGGEWSREDVVA